MIYQKPHLWPESLPAPSPALEASGDQRLSGCPIRLPRSGINKKQIAFQKNSLDETGISCYCMLFFNDAYWRGDGKIRQRSLCEAASISASRARSSLAVTRESNLLESVEFPSGLVEPVEGCCVACLQRTGRLTRVEDGRPLPFLGRTGRPKRMKVSFWEQTRIKNMGQTTIKITLASLGSIVIPTQKHHRNPGVHHIPLPSAKNRPISAFFFVTVGHRLPQPPEICRRRRSSSCRKKQNDVAKEMFFLCMFSLKGDKSRISSTKRDWLWCLRDPKVPSPLPLAC